LNLEENVSCKNLIWFDTKLLRTQRLVSDARRNVRLYTTIKQGGICRGEAGELPPHWIWPSLPQVCLKTSLPGKGWFPVTHEILLNCSSYQSTLSKGSKQIVFNFDNVMLARLAMAQYCRIHITYLLFMLWFQPRSSFMFTRDAD